jgi:serine/threonine protein phosphatase PrpC
MYCETASTSLTGDRSENQDRCAVLEDGDTRLLLLADGMGGHARGELAAVTFIESLARALPSSREQTAAEFLQHAFEQAHDDINTAGREAAPPAEPHTTGVACLVRGDRACWAHSGDSRLYLLRDERVLLRTKDHSLVEELIQLGELSEQDRDSHPLRNQVTRALGGRQPPGTSLSAETVLIPGDVLLLCSDGLWSAVSETRLTELLRASSLQDCVERLASEAAANSAPASDNVTLVALRVRED